MNPQDQNLADALRQADEALRRVDEPTSFNHLLIQSLHQRKMRKKRLQMLLLLFLSCSILGPLVFQAQYNKRFDFANGDIATRSQMSTIATVDSAVDGPAVINQPKFQPPIELELEREAVAVVFLNRALRFRRAGEYPDEAKAALDFIVNTFPTTISAEHARMLLNSPSLTSIIPGENL